MAAQRPKVARWLQQDKKNLFRTNVSASKQPKIKRFKERREKKIEKEKQQQSGKETKQNERENQRNI